MASISDITESYCWPSQGAVTQWAIIASLIVLSKTLHTHTDRDTHKQQAAEKSAPIKKKQNDTPLFFNSSSLLMGIPLFLALQCNQPEGYFSPRHLTCPAACSVTDKPSGFALSFVPADGTVVLMGHSGVLESCKGEVLQSVSNSNTILTVKCRGEMWGMDEPAPWQQKQRGGSIAKTPKATLHALFPGFPLSPITRCSLGLTVHECWRVQLISIQHLYICCKNKWEKHRSCNSTIFPPADNSQIRCNFFWMQN